eukprot:4244294-Ditylum_brightwellii.AAC.1
MSPPQIPRDDLGQHLMAAVEVQHDLGWDNFMKGRVATHWGHAQEVHFNIFHTDSTQYTKLGWEKELIILIWNSFYHVWASRNDALHNLSHDTNS